MKNYDYWRNFTRTGKINDYLNYIACTREEPERSGQASINQTRATFKEGGFIAGINNSDGNGPVGHAGWGLR